MKKVKFFCDYCGEELSEASHKNRYRLALSSEELPRLTDVMYSVEVPPPLGREYHYCNFECLSNWIIKNENKR